MQPDQSAGRPAESVHAGHGLLPAVAPLLQVHGGAEQSELVGDGPMIAVHADPRYAGRDPPGLLAPTLPAGGRGRQHLGELRAGDEELVPTE